MGILLVYDVTDEASFSNIRNWMKNIEQHASDNVTKARTLSGRAGDGGGRTKRQAPSVSAGCNSLGTWPRLKQHLPSSRQARQHTAANQCTS